MGVEETVGKRGNERRGLHTETALQRKDGTGQSIWGREGPLGIQQGARLLDDAQAIVVQLDQWSGTHS